MINKEIQDYIDYLLFLKYDRQLVWSNTTIAKMSDKHLVNAIKYAVFGSLITKHLKDNKGKLYRKPIPIYKFGDNLKESDSLERQALYSLLII